MQPDETKVPEGSPGALLEHYLELVAFWLPRKERRDILAELAGEMRAEWKEQEAELGRALTESEMEALLERWGHPLRIAGRYLPRRHLIGPEVFPLYAFALKTIALVYLGPWLLVWLGFVLFSPAYRAAHPGWELVGTLSSFWSIAFFSFGGLTLAFALLERSFARSGTLPEWNPRRALEPDPDAISRAGSGLELVAYLAFLVWWLNPVPLPGFGPTGARDVWLALHARLLVPVLLLLLAGAALASFNWIRPRWTRARRAGRTAVHGAWTLLCVRVLVDFADVGVQLERISAARAADAEADALVAVARLAVFAWFLILAVVFTWSFAKDALRVLRWERAHFRTASCALVALVVAGLAPDSRAQSGAAQRAITLLDLATQTSALPTWPSHAAPDADGNLPDYSDVALYDFLSAHALAREPGTQWEYSNLGFGLLGHALALRAGKEYEELVRARITAPLGMASTAITLTPALRERLAAGHDAELAPRPEWNVPAFAGAGSLRSTANDLLTFLAAAAGLVETPLAPAFEAMLATRRPGPGFEQALGWWVISFGPGDAGLVTHGGATHGFACTLAYDPSTRTGAVVLSNSTVDDGGLAWHLLRPAFPVATSAGAGARGERAVVAVAADVLGRLAGVYRPASGDPLTIELRDGALWFVSEHAPAGLRLHAASEREFFASEVEFGVVFEADGAGVPTGLIVRFAGSDTPATRIEGQTKEL